jgi:urease gamma subunit
MTTALYLAEESRASAELASARTEMLRQKEVNDDMQQSIETLKQEMLRNSGTRQ